MSATEVKKFFEKLAKDDGLRNEIMAAAREAEDRMRAVSEIASRHGYQFSAEELGRILNAAQGVTSSELTEDELDAVAAGMSIFQEIKFAPPYVPVGPV